VATAHEDIGAEKLLGGGASAAQPSGETTAIGVPSAPLGAGSSTARLARRSGGQNLRAKRTRPPRFLLMAFIYVGDDLLSHTLSRAARIPTPRPFSPW
jgi:hypothetical protein